MRFADKCLLLALIELPLGYGGSCHPRFVGDNTWHKTLVLLSL